MKRYSMTVLSIVILAVLLSGCTHRLNTVANNDASETVSYLDLRGKSAAELWDLDRYPNLAELIICDMKLDDLTPLLQCRTLVRLDARGCGLTTAQYELLAEALPDCTILWDVPIAGMLFDNTSASITLPDCDAAELEQLKYFICLSNLDVCAVTDDTAVYEICRRYPTWNIARKVHVCGRSFDSLDETIDLSGLTISSPEDLKGLEYLSRVKRLDLTGPVRTLEEIQQFSQTYPWVEFLFTFSLDGVTMGATDTEVDLTGHTGLDFDTMTVALGYLKNLKKLTLSGCNLTDDELLALRALYPEVKIIWTVQIGSSTLRTDATVFAFEGSAKERLTDEDLLPLRCCTDLVGLDLRRNAIESLDFLSGLTTLRVLILPENNISDLAPLAKLSELRYLELHMNYHIESLAPLKELVKLTDLNLSYLTRAKDYDALYSLPGLQRLWLVRCGVRTAERNALHDGISAGCRVFISENSSAAGGGWFDGETASAVSSLFETGILPALFE